MNIKHGDNFFFLAGPSFPHLFSQAKGILKTKVKYLKSGGGQKGGGWGKLI